MTSSSNDPDHPNHSVPSPTPEDSPSPPCPLTGSDWIAIWQQLRECAAVFHEGLHRLEAIERHMYGAQPEYIQRIIATLPVRREVHLSRREREVLLLAGAGLSNLEIGQVLDISGGTVKNYMTSILTKFGTRTRWEAVLRARESGLI